MSSIHTGTEQHKPVMMKRPAEEASDYSHKKQKHSHQHNKHLDNYSSSRQNFSSKPYNNSDSKHHKHNDKSRSKSYHQNGEKSKSHHSNQNQDNPNDIAIKPRKPLLSSSEALAQLPPPTSKSAHVPAYTPFTVPPGLPPLPPIHNTELSTAPFKHKSIVPHTRSSSTTDISYERLEFLGDAYIELIASRLIFERFIQLTAGQQSQLRELLVKNETLAEYSRAYGFDQRLEAAAVERMMEDSVKSGGKGNKGFNKVLGDVFEAYLAALVLSDVEDGFGMAETWLTALWAPKLVEAAKEFRGFANNPGVELVHGQGTDLRTVYNPNGKAELQKRIVGGREVRLEYETYQDSVELKGDHLGQNRHFIAVYLSGYGYSRKLLGKGEGKNKVEAGNWAATDAMQGEAKGIVEECEEKLQVIRDEKKAKQAAEAAEITAS